LDIVSALTNDAMNPIIHFCNISTNDTYVITPADRPNDAASTRREVSFTSDGKNTTDAPIAVAAPAPQTRAKAMPTLPSAVVVVDDM
jgi:hypothetical protein